MRSTVRKTLTLIGATTAALAIGVAPASAANHDAPSASASQVQASDGATHALSPDTKQAWETFISGGNALTGGAAMLVSGAWIGAPAIVYSAAGMPLTPDQQKAWEDWNRGGKLVGRGAAMLVSGAWVGAPSSIMDLIAGGAVPSDLTEEQLSQVTVVKPLK